METTENKRNLKPGGGRKVYISLPITGREKAARRQADGMKVALSKLGYRPVSPFDIWAGKDATYEDHICHDLRAMLDCDSIYFCRGWRQSLGCRIEHDVATRFNESGRKDIFIYHEDDDYPG